MSRTFGYVTRVRTHQTICFLGITSITKQQLYACVQSSIVAPGQKKDTHREACLGGGAVGRPLHLPLINSSENWKFLLGVPSPPLHSQPTAFDLSQIKPWYTHSARLQRVEEGEGGRANNARKFRSTCFAAVYCRDKEDQKEWVHHIPHT